MTDLGPQNHDPETLPVGTPLDEKPDRKLAVGVAALFTGAATIFTLGRVLLARRVERDRR